MSSSTRRLAALPALGLGLSLAAALAAGTGLRMRQPVIAVGGWLAALAAVLLAARTRRDGHQEGERWKASDWLAAASLLALGLLLRLPDLAGNPWIHSDNEASVGLAAVDFVSGVRDNPFTVSWFSFPTLFFLLESLSIRVLGRSVESLRVLPACVGALAVVATYGLGREMFGRRVGLLAGLYLSAMPFHVHFSRLGLNNVFDSLSIAIFSWGLWRGWKTGTRGPVLISGLALGLGLYFYATIRAAVLVLGLWLVAVWRSQRESLRDNASALAGLLAAAAIAFLPLGIYYLWQPAEFLAPLSRASVFSVWIPVMQQRFGDPAWWIMVEQLANALLGVVVVDLRELYAGQPLLLAPAAAAFMLGVTVLGRRWRQPQYLWVALWLATALGIVALSTNAPTSQRYILATPAAAITLALGLDQASSWLTGRNLRLHGRTAVIAGAALAGIVGYDLYFYFQVYAREQRFGDYHVEVATALAEYLAREPNPPYVYFFGLPRMGFRTLDTMAYLVPKADGEDIEQPLQGPPDWTLNGSSVFVFMPHRLEDVGWIVQRYPGGEMQLRYGRGPYTLFAVYRVEPVGDSWLGTGELPNRGGRRNQ
jgi:4-amino-4-deoxy-L-arabinose transferase-like glycosyltransferase